MSEDKREQKNNKILVIGVSVFAGLFFFLWIFNTQRLIFTDSSNLNSQEQDQTWENIQEEFSQSFKQMNQAWQEAQESPVKEESEEFVDSFKDMIEEESVKKQDKNNLESFPESEDIENSEVADKSTDHCPEYVNCMPTYDELPEDFCVVPPGCEDVTLKVY